MKKTTDLTPLKEILVEQFGHGWVDADTMYEWVDEHTTYYQSHVDEITESELVDSEMVEVYDGNKLLKTLCNYYWGDEYVLDVKIEGDKIVVTLKDEIEFMRVC